MPNQKDDKAKSYESMTRNELIEIAKKKRIKYSGMKKHEIIDLLRKNGNKSRKNFSISKKNSPRPSGANSFNELMSFRKDLLIQEAERSGLEVNYGDTKKILAEKIIQKRRSSSNKSKRKNKVVSPTASLDSEAENDFLNNPEAMQYQELSELASNKGLKQGTKDQMIHDLKKHYGLIYSSSDSDSESEQEIYISEDDSSSSSDEDVRNLYESMSMSELKGLLKKRGLDINGNKSQLITRLNDNDGYFSSSSHEDYNNNNGKLDRDLNPRSDTETDTELHVYAQIVSDTEDLIASLRLND